LGSKLKDKIKHWKIDFCEDLYGRGEVNNENYYSHKVTGTESSSTILSPMKSGDFYELSPKNPKYEHIPLDVNVKILVREHPN
jgi:hypothetical protein